MERNMVIRCVLFAALICSFCFTVEAIQIGDSAEHALRELGPPDAKVKRGDKTIWFYCGGAVEIKSGKVFRFDGHLSAEVKSARVRKADDAAKRAAGLKLVEGQWMTSREIEARKNVPPKQAAQKVAEGALPPLDSMSIKGRVTVIDFYADWCAPCRAIAPRLDALARKYSDVELRKIDIKNWKSPEAQQYNIRSIPAIYVFDKKGKRILGPSSSLNQVAAAVETARFSPVNRLGADHKGR